jgi:hypothetical protein
MMFWKLLTLKKPLPVKLKTPTRKRRKKSAQFFAKTPRALDRLFLNSRDAAFVLFTHLLHTPWSPGLENPAFLPGILPYS